MKRLLIRPGAIGDFLLSLPALEHLRADYTEVWCGAQNVPLACFADHARSIGSSGLDRLGVLPADDVIDRLAAFDEIHSWYGTARPDFRNLVSHLPFRFHLALPDATGGRHATDFYCAQVGAPVQLPRLSVPARPREGFAVIHPFASRRDKRWPLENFEELAAALGDVRWCAGPEEPGVFSGGAEAVRICDLFELGCWLATAGVYIGNDSGITHLAAAVGTPVIALFGPTDPAVWAPRGPRVRVLSGMPMQRILPTDVLAALSSLVPSLV
jgi:ADP-heptose:LPS heptosyltransferase